MPILKTFIQNIILLSTIIVVLSGTESLYKIIECCAEKNVNIDIDIELEDDFESEVELKTFFQNEKNDICLLLIRSLSKAFSFQETIIHNDLAVVFGPPPDFYC